VRARVPGSTSNLGPGFDVLAIAVSRHVEVALEPAPALEIRSFGEGSDLPTDRTHLAARVVASVLGHDRVAITVRSDVPPSRGLGSSAALALAAAAAAGADDPLEVAVRFEGHAENAAASLLGGLVAATIVGGAPVARSLPLDPRLSYVLLVPDRRLATKDARAVLPERVPMADAVHNLGRLGLLVAGLGDRTKLLAAAGDDRLHQDARAALFPEAPRLLEALRIAGATVACWSGAGPSLLGICDSAAVAGDVRRAGERALAEAGVAGTAEVLAADTRGLVVER